MHVTARKYRLKIVLCDIGLPGMDGYQVAESFREDKALKDIFLVSLTGYTSLGDRDWAIRA